MKAASLLHRAGGDPLPLAGGAVACGGELNRPLKDNCMLLRDGPMGGCRL